MQATDAESPHVLSRLSLDRGSVSCGCAVAVIETVGGVPRWWVVVYDAETETLPAADQTVELYAITREGRQLSGRARIESTAPTLRFAALRGAGLLLVGEGGGRRKR
jgi:hypothetical protein